MEVRESPNNGKKLQFTDLAMPKAGASQLFFFVLIKMLLQTTTI